MANKRVSTGSPPSSPPFLPPCSHVIDMTPTQVRACHHSERWKMSRAAVSRNDWSERRFRAILCWIVMFTRVAASFPSSPLCNLRVIILNLSRLNSAWVRSSLFRTTCSNINIEKFCTKERFRWSAMCFPFLSHALLGKAGYNSFSIKNCDLHHPPPSHPPQLVQIRFWLPPPNNESHWLFSSLPLSQFPLSLLSFLATDWGQEFSRGKHLEPVARGPEALAKEEKKKKTEKK